MKPTIDHFGDTSVIRLESAGKGLADTHRLEGVINHLVEDGEKQIVLDLSKLKNIGSELVGLFIKTIPRLAKREGFLFLFGVNGVIREYLETLGIDQHIKILENEAGLRIGRFEQ